MRLYPVFNHLTACSTILQVSGSFRNLSTNDVMMNSRFKIPSLFLQIRKCDMFMFGKRYMAKPNYSNCKPILPIIAGRSEVGFY